MLNKRSDGHVADPAEYGTELRATAADLAQGTEPAVQTTVLAPDPAELLEPVEFYQALGACCNWGFVRGNESDAVGG